MFVVVEGPDGVGKTTFVREFAKRLERAGHKVRRTREPYTNIKAVLEKRPNIDNEDLYLLFLFDRVVHVDRVINKTPKNVILISDRYWQSSWVYQGLMGIDENKILADNITFPQPDVMILLTAPVNVIASRMKHRGRLDPIEERMKVEEIVQRYEAVAKISEALGIKVIRIETTSDIKETVEEAFEKFQKVL